MRNFTRGQWLLLTIGVMASIAYSTIPFSSGLELVSYDLPIAITVFAIWHGARRCWTQRRWPWALIGLSLSGFLAAELIWWIYQYQGLDPFPSMADVVFLIAYGPLALGAAALARGDDPSQRERFVWIDATLLTIVAGASMWELLLEPYATDPEASWLERTAGLGYPLADILVLGFLARLVLMRSVRTRATTLFVAGVGLMLVADVTFSYTDLYGEYHAGSLLDAMWLMSYILIGLAALDRTAGDVPVYRADARLNRTRLLGIMAALVVPQVVLLIELGDLGQAGMSTAFVTGLLSAAVAILVGWRLWKLNVETQRLEAQRGSDRLSALIEHSTDAIVLLDASLVITFASPSAIGVFGIPPDLMVGSHLLDVVIADDRPATNRMLLDLVTAPAGSLVDLELGLHRPDGDARTAEGTARSLLSDPNVQALVITLRDVTSRRELEAQLERRAFHDDLTGLANRALFSDRVAHALERVDRSPDEPLAVLFIDLDDFKGVNDGLGHNAGDELLRQVGDRIRLCLRPGDTVARLGGDEFGVLIETLPSPLHATRLAERILEMLALPMPVTGVSLAASASIGIAPAGPGVSVDDLLRDADIAMYSAKTKGKGRYELFDDDLRRAAERTLQLKIDMPGALRSGQFRVVYQPIRDVESDEMVALEALCRWDHPTLGNVVPVEFIAAAEESGFIVELGRWVLREACRQAARWNVGRTRPIGISINVSGVQFEHSGFVSDVAAALGRAELAAELLTLEITESVLIDSDRIDANLRALRNLGIGIAIDDFGTGYSSLSYLQRFPVTSVKIDRAFVSELGSAGAGGLVRSVIAIAEALALNTIAEGVETAEQLQVLSQLDCGMAQGNYLGEPASPEAIDAILADSMARQRPGPHGADST